MRAGDRFWIAPGTAMKAYYTGDLGPARFVTERNWPNVDVPGTRYFGRELTFAQAWALDRLLTHAGSRPVPAIGQRTVLPLLGSRVAATGIPLLLRAAPARPYAARLFVVAGRRMPVAEWTGLTSRAVALRIDPATLRWPPGDIGAAGSGADLDAELDIETEGGVETVALRLASTPPDTPTRPAADSAAELAIVHRLDAAGWGSEALLRCATFAAFAPKPAAAAWSDLLAALCGERAVMPQSFRNISWHVQMGRSAAKRPDGGR